MIIPILNGHAWAYHDEYMGLPTLFHWGADRRFRTDELAEIMSRFDEQERHYRLFATDTGYVAGYGHIVMIECNPDGSGKYRFEGVGVPDMRS